MEKITAYLHMALTRQSNGGIAHQAIAAIENALVDLKAKALGIPVYARCWVDWCAIGCSFTGRIAVDVADQPCCPHQGVGQGFDPIRSWMMWNAGAEKADQGFKGLKTNIFRYDGPERRRAHARSCNGPGWRRS